MDVNAQKVLLDVLSWCSIREKDRCRRRTDPPLFKLETEVRGSLRKRWLRPRQTSAGAETCGGTGRHTRLLFPTFKCMLAAKLPLQCGRPALRPGQPRGHLSKLLAMREAYQSGAVQ